MTSTLKLDKADQEVVTESGSADDSDSVSGSELARKKSPTLPVQGQVQQVTTRLLILSEGCQQKPLI